MPVSAPVAAVGWHTVKVLTDEVAVAAACGAVAHAQLHMQYGNAAQQQAFILERLIPGVSHVEVPELCRAAHTLQGLNYEEWTEKLKHANQWHVEVY